MSGRAFACVASLCSLVSLFVVGEARMLSVVGHRIVGQDRDRGQGSSRSPAGRRTLASLPGRPNLQRSVVSPADAVRAGGLGEAFTVDTSVVLGPACGPQYSYGAASNGDGWRVMWGTQYDNSVNTSRIGADGLLSGDGVGVVGHDAGMNGRVVRSIVGTGTGFVAVWTTRRIPSRVWASRLDSGGVLIDSLSVLEGDSSQGSPAVAFDGDSTCLVVWMANRNVYAARLTTSGQVLDTIPIPVAQEPSQRELMPAVAFGQGVYLVAWTAYDSSNWTTARARRVSAAGVLLDTAILLRHDPAVKQAWPVVTFGDTCFLAAWSEGMGRSDVYAARVSASGDLIDTAGVQLSSGPTNDMFPSVGFDGTRYLVMWQERDTLGSSNHTVCGRLMTVDGVPLDSSLIRPAPSKHSCAYPNVAVDHENFLVAFSTIDSLTNDANGCCVRISSDGAVLDSGVFFPLSADAQTDPNGASNGTDFLATWTETRSQGEVVQASRISADGSVLDPVGFTVIDAPGGVGYLASGFGDSLYLVAWTEHRSAFYAVCCARVSPEGQVLDSGGMVVCDESLSQECLDISFDGQNFLVVWIDRSSGTNGDICAARVSPDGVVLDPGGFAVAADTFDDWWPVLCFTGTDYLVAWMEGYWQGHSDIYGALVSPAGVVTKPRFVVSDASGDQLFPAVAPGPASSLVAWEDTRSLASDIYAARVQVDGTVLDPSGFAVAVSGSNERRPRVTSDDTGFRVLWYWWQPSTTTFGAGRVDTAGNVTHVGDWFGLPGSAAFDAAYGSGPELLLLFSCWTDTALGRYYGSDRLWARLGDVPGIEQAQDLQSRRATDGASIVRGVLHLGERVSSSPSSSAGHLMDVSGRKVLNLQPGANDVRALAPGVYFVRTAQAQAQAVQKVVVTR